MAPPRKPCRWPEFGVCGKQSGCQESNCGFCTRHCICEKQDALFSPYARRSNRPETDAKIQSIAADETPRKTKQVNAGDTLSRKDIDAFLPIQDRRLHSAQFSLATSDSMWRSLTRYTLDVIDEIGAVFSESPLVREGVQQRLLEEVGRRRLIPLAEDGVVGYGSTSGLVGALHNFGASCLRYACSQQTKRSSNEQHNAKDVVRAIAVETMLPKHIQELQEHAGVPHGEMLVYGKYQRRQGRRYFRKIIENEVDSDDDDGKVVTKARVAAHVVEFAVSFIVERCNFLSWGLKKVKLGSETIEIPKLTRKCVPEEMWEEYQQSLEAQKMSFENIVGYTKPLRQSSEYKGSAINLEIQWQHTAATTIEPLADFMKDDPVSCAQFGFENNLLDQSGWRRLRRLLNAEGKPVEGKASTKKAFYGGRHMLQRTAFLHLVRAITAEDEKLVTAVDYVKGVLVLDVVHVLQQIIDDHIPGSANEEKKRLTKSLTVLSNFLKNQYKHHVFVGEDQNSGTHGAEHGLLAPLWPEAHYSEMGEDELDTILSRRNIKHNCKTKIARVRLLHDEDKKRTTNSTISKPDETTTTDASGDDHEFTTVSIHRTSDELLYINRVSAMNIRELRAEIRLQGLNQKATSCKPLRDALIAEWQRENTVAEYAEDEGVTLSSSRDSDDNPTIQQASMEDLGVDTEVESQCHCNSCAFLHYFMLEELPRAINQRLDATNHKSIQNALRFINDTHEKFMLYQGHVVRTWNQSRALEGMEKKLFDECCRSKNTKPKLLWIIVDYKMKWEAMHQREKMTEGFGKRGTSWHGNYIFYYVWNDAEEKPVKHIAKLDQIIDGTNEQTGTNVLALIEAMLVFSREEFDGASIEFLQSDNAQCYHLKELIFGIAQLNAKMKREGGPTINNFVHTETQDGKSLLDAHFAHATAIVKRYLRRVRSNRLNKVTSPSELVDAISSRGGLQNCGVQLVGIDDDFTKKLKILSDDMSLASKKLKEYFTRCNEINYFPLTDSEDGKKFCIHVKAYSNIGHGTRFEVDVENGQVEILGDLDDTLDDGSICAMMQELEIETSNDNNAHNKDVMEGERTAARHNDAHKDNAETDGDASSDDESSCQDSDDLSVDEVMTAREICLGDDEEDDEDDNQEQLEVLLREAFDEEEQDWREKQLVSTNGNLAYWAPNMMTGVKVEKYMPLGKVLSATEVSKQVQQRQAKHGDGGMLGMDVVSQGLGYLMSHGYSTLGIRHALDENVVDEFKRAARYRVPDRFKMGPGWARRKPRGQMYGKKYINDYREDIVAWFLRGVENSSLKMGPSIQIEMLRRKYPDVYTLPNFVEVQTLISNLFDRQKKGKPLNSIIESGDNEDEDEEYSLSLGESEDGHEIDSIIRRAVAVVEQYGGEIEPKWVLILVGQEKIAANDKKIVMKAITKKRNTLKKLRKTSVIG